MKQNIIKRVAGTITIVSLIATLSGGCAAATNDIAAESSADSIKVLYDGEAISFDVEPQIINDRVMVPMRAIYEAFGAKVKWDSETQTITSKKKSKTITMTIGSTDITKNDEVYTFDTAPVIEDGRTLIPVRAVSELLGLDVDWDEDTKTVIITTQEDEDDDAWKSNTGTINLSSMTVSGDGISVDGSVVTITSGGDFTVTGECSDGQIVIDSKDKVKLRLSGMSLTNKSGSAIYVKNADKAYITLTENTENTLSDGEEYTSGDEKENGTITARDNLEIKGSGSLTVNGNYKNGIDADDSLDIEKGNITITAVNDGINVNDTLSISDGTLNVTAESDGIQAGDIIDITGGTVNITTTGDVPESQSEKFGFGGGRGMWQQQSQDAAQPEETDEETDEDSEDVTSKGIKADWLIDISGGTITVNSTDHAIQCDDEIVISGGDLTLSSDRKKGIKGGGNVTIDDGKINITKSTEGIESKAIMTINGGDINIVASDDGLNAGGGMSGGFGGRQRDWESMNSDGESDASDRTDMPQNFGRRGGGRRGMGGDMQNMTPPDMQNGDMPEMPDGMTPPDMRGGMPDGMTPPDMQGGMPDGMTPPDIENGGFGGMNRMNRETDEISTEHHIQINGGTIYIEAQSDGIDANGTIQIDGGTVTVNAQVSGAESAFDADSAILFNGGTIIGISGPGLDESPNSYSKQNVIIAYTTSSLSAGDKVVIKDSNGNEIFNETAAIGGSKIVASSEKFVTGETYTIEAGGETLTATIEGVITSVGTKTQGMGGGMGGGRRGMRDMQQDVQNTQNEQ